MDGSTRLRGKKVVVVGGGTGTYTTLVGLRNYPDLELVAVVSMADDGGSNKVLRDEFGMLPTSGVRQCMVALSQNEGLLRKLFSYRFYQGVGIRGMTFGNLFMAAATDIVGSSREAILATSKVLGVRGRILPVSYEQVALLAQYEDGREVLGEHLIDQAGQIVGDKRVVSLRTIPRTQIDDEAKAALVAADLIVLGPGDLYTNTIANLVIDGVSEAVVKSRAKVVVVINLMSKRGESPNYRASDFLTDIGKYLPLSRIDYVVVNTDQKIAKAIIKKYKEEGGSLVMDDLVSWPYGKVVRAKLVAKGIVKRERGDAIDRSMVRHDPDKLAKVLVGLL